MFMQMRVSDCLATLGRRRRRIATVCNFPQKRQRFRANGLLAINYINTLPAKFCNILTVQKLCSDFLVVFRMHPRKSGVCEKGLYVCYFRTPHYFRRS
jgi:hypothetical protein